MGGMLQKETNCLILTYSIQHTVDMLKTKKLSIHRILLQYTQKQKEPS